MRKCPNCGREEDGIFCSKCGYRLETIYTDENDSPDNRLLLKAGSFHIGTHRKGTINENWIIYSDGRFQVTSSIDLGGGAKEETVQNGKMNTSEFCDLCKAIDTVDWTNSWACIEGGHCYSVSVYDAEGNITRFGDSVTANNLDIIIKRLPHISLRRINDEP